MPTLAAGDPVEIRKLIGSPARISYEMPRSILQDSYLCSTECLIYFNDDVGSPDRSLAPDPLRKLLRHSLVPH